MSSTRTAALTPTHDARHCGHVSRSESPTVKRAAILAECLVSVEGFALPESEPAAVVAVVEAILAGVSCSHLAALAGAAAWADDAAAWADDQGEAFHVLPSTPAAARTYGQEGTGLAFLLPMLDALREARV